MSRTRAILTAAMLLVILWGAAGCDKRVSSAQRQAWERELACPCT